MADKNNEHQITFTISITKDGIAAGDLIARAMWNVSEEQNETTFWKTYLEQHHEDTLIKAYRIENKNYNAKEEHSATWLCRQATEALATKENIDSIIDKLASAKPGCNVMKCLDNWENEANKNKAKETEGKSTTILGKELLFKYIKHRSTLIACLYLQQLFQAIGSGNTVISIATTITDKESRQLPSQIKALVTASNVILHGAPGTGKTYTAQHLAHAITGKPVGGDNEQYGFVQFHPSYDYTDFVEGLRPVNRGNNNIGFALRPGIFMEFVDKARRNPSKQYVFVIDEINRGDISKIFGELFFSIDPGYRGEKGEVTTQYANMHDTNVPESKQGEWNDDHTYNFFPKFYIPDNVYIIGTMNDIDRSVDTFDFAMRRRFRFIEITAEDSQAMLNDKPKAEDAKTLMNDINNALDSYKLDGGYHIGASYFLDLADGQLTKEDLWSDKLRPLIIEYLRGTGEKLDSNISLDDFLKDKQSTN
ncbi:McrB family protein [Bifidobacterium stellenboschense]|uniref:Putative endonuclease n=1 Tax=Bifidobacterium stellenboschense TaxID=762211 RepID=A0A087DMZ5_9BIFI|nr:AAA family ATPase [Bifidobacterium stellenboschense]KFI96895.1 putative endonuclease [Bifidobacterium stellenboschense]